MTKNVFPLKSLPEQIVNIISGMNAASGFPINYLAASILWALSVAIGRSCTLFAKSTWEVAANLFVGLVAAKGRVKSPTLKFALGPLIKVDQAQLGSDGQRQLTANDATLEGLYQALENNPYGIGMYRDELRGFFTSMNRYRSGGGDEEAWLSLYNGIHITINRRTEKKRSIPNAYVSLIGTVQHDILQNMSFDARVNGFWERFLWTFSEDDKPLQWNLSGQDITGAYASAWAKIVNGVLERGGYFNDAFKHKAYQLSPESANKLQCWQNHNAMAYAENEALSSIFTKIAEHAMKISLILQVTREILGVVPASNVVDIDSARNAIEIADFFFAEARKVHDMNPVTETWIDDLADTFTTAEAIAAGQAHGLSARTVKYRLKNPYMFKWIGHGRYFKANRKDEDAAEESIPDGVIAGVGAQDHDDTPDGSGLEGESSDAGLDGGGQDGEIHDDVPDGGGQDGEDPDNEPDGGGQDGEDPDNEPDGGGQDGKVHDDAEKDDVPDTQDRDDAQDGSGQDGEVHEDVETDDVPETPDHDDVPDGSGQDGEGHNGGSGDNKRGTPTQIYRYYAHRPKRPRKKPNTTHNTNNKQPTLFEI